MKYLLWPVLQLWRLLEAVMFWAHQRREMSRQTNVLPISEGSTASCRSEVTEHDEAHEAAVQLAYERERAMWNESKKRLECHFSSGEVPIPLSWNGRHLVPRRTNPIDVVRWEHSLSDGDAITWHKGPRTNRLTVAEDYAGQTRGVA